MVIVEGTLTGLYLKAGSVRVESCVMGVLELELDIYNFYELIKDIFRHNM